MNTHIDHLQGDASIQWRTQQIFREVAKFRHNRVTSQINFRGSAEGTTILGVSGVMPTGKILQNYT